MRNLVAILVSAASLLVLSCGTDRSDDGGTVRSYPVSFVVFGNSGHSSDDGTTFESMAGALRGSDFEFAVDLGDRLPGGVSSGGIDALLGAADADRALFEVPLYTLPGDRDIFDYQSDVAWSMRYGPLWYSFERGGTLFLVLHTEDESYRSGFGVRARFGPEQLDWLAGVLEDSNPDSRVAFLHRPLWEEDPVVWRTVLAPVLRAGGVDLIVAAWDEGIFDWGRIDGIRAVTTGCTGPVDRAAPGLFPHVLRITVHNGSAAFSVLTPDGSVQEGIGIDREYRGKIDAIAERIVPPVLDADDAWRISSSVRITLDNPLSEPIGGVLDFTVFDGTSWEVTPSSLDMGLAPGEKKTFRLTLAAEPPEMGPQPVYRAELDVGGVPVFSSEGILRVAIPPQRKGEPVPVEVSGADILPYAFDGGALRIPLEIGGVDACGRCIIYRTVDGGRPECVFVSPLRDFRAGMNEIVWNGRDMRGNPVPPDTLVCRLFVYNKKAPATWVAAGPEDPSGTVTVERNPAGLAVVTHDDGSLLRYRIGVSSSIPAPERIMSFDDILDGRPLTGFVRGEGNRVYLGTQAGIASALVRREEASIDPSFGENGYVRLKHFRGRRLGSPAYANGIVYVGVGGTDYSAPGVALIDSGEGLVRGFVDLGGYFGNDPEPPAVTATPDGVWCAHPSTGMILRMTRFGDVVWAGDSSSWVIGTDSDGRSHIYGIGVDADGFSYFNTPGTSARCVVVGPDGYGLFRVILVSLPGLRVSDVVPVIEERPTDGLYFVTRGGDIPYVFHVPFTVRTGIIVDEADYTE